MKARFRLPFGWRTCSVVLRSRMRVDSKSFVVLYSVVGTEESNYLLNETGLHWSDGLQSYYQYLTAGPAGEVVQPQLTLPHEVDQLNVEVRPWRGSKRIAFSALHGLKLRVSSLSNALPGTLLMKPEREAA